MCKAIKYLWNVVAAFLDDGVKPGEDKHGLRTINQATFRHKLGRPVVISSQYILFDARW